LIPTIAIAASGIKARTSRRNLMPPTAVFFDMDGVLLDSFEAWLAVMNTAAIHFDCPPVARNLFRDLFGQSTQADAEMFYPGRTAAEVDAFYIAHFHEYAALVIPTPGAKNLLDDLDDCGIPTAVVTNTHSEIARPVLEGLDLIPHALIAADDVKSPKPAPDMIFRGCEVLDLTPWDLLVVGGSKIDKQAAAAAGASFAGFRGMAGNFTIDRITDVRAILDGTYN
jgi:beta-phosphoglucomutase-like phosphatase (HAD superfamily)